MSRPSRRTGASRARASGGRAATATRGVTPDLVVIGVHFAGTGRTRIEAGRNLARVVGAHRRALVAAGLPRDSIVPGRSSPSYYDWTGRIEQRVGTRTIDPPRRIDYGGDNYGYVREVADTTYRATDVLQVRLRDFSKLQAVTDSALAYDAERIDEPRWTASDTDAARLGAIDEATRQALRQARAMAAAAGGRLGRALELSTDADESRSRILFSVTTTGASADGQAVAAPRLQVQATVTGRWELLAPAP